MHLIMKKRFLVSYSHRELASDSQPEFWQRHSQKTPGGQWIKTGELRDREILSREENVKECRLGMRRASGRGGVIQFRWTSEISLHPLLNGLSVVGA